ncbi:MAG: GAF domain-containing sensor histidine kinase [Phycisphaerales bacterium]|jgi:signal transduction histidine kinase
MGESKPSAQTDKIYDSINELASALTGTGSLSEKLGQVVNELRGITRADGTSIWLKEGKILWCIAGKGHYENMQKGKIDEAKYDMNKDDSLTVWIAKSGETINIKSNKELENYPHWKGKYDNINYPNKRSGRKCESFLGTPLKIGGDIIGVMKADNHRGKDNKFDCFSKEEEKLFEILAALTAIIIKNDRMQQEARRRKEQAKRRRDEMKVRQEMAAIVVHGLENPAAGVRNALQNIKIAVDDKTLQKEIIGRSIRNGLREVQEILSTRETFLSFINPKRKANWERINFCVFINDIIEVWGPLYPNVDFKFNKQKSVVPMSVPVHALKTTLNCLIENAIEATFDVSKPRILINLTLPKSHAKHKRSKPIMRIANVEVIDNGEGVSEDIRQKLFKKLFISTKARMGLGLYVCRKVMKKLGGDIKYNPNTKIGAKFVVRFPFAEGEVS